MELLSFAVFLTEDLEITLLILLLLLDYYYYYHHHHHYHRRRRHHRHQDCNGLMFYPAVYVQSVDRKIDPYCSWNSSNYVTCGASLIERGMWFHS
jgi:hypothetical protein